MLNFSFRERKMINFTFSELAQKWAAVHQGAEVDFQFISTDTRKIQPGEVFVALQGPHYDGHDFIADAAAKGAVGAVVSKEVEAAIPLLIVDDTRIALGKMAKLRRQAVNIPCIAITGSCGKTTTKTLTAAIFAQCGKTLATQGTLNNDIGVPLTLLKLTEEHEFAVIELGANHLGEIAYIADMTQPDAAVITNAAPVHLEGFGSVAGVAKGKGEIYASLRQGGTAIINADDEFADFWRQANTQRQVLTFGIKQPADISAAQIQFNDEQLPAFELITPAGNIHITLNLMGQHNVLNALAAAAAAQALDIPLAKIKAGLESVLPVDKRLVQRRGINDALLIDDTYNANPQAFKMAIEILSRAKGQKILVMGDMGELGENAAAYHAQVGKVAREYGIDQLHAVGILSQLAVEQFGNQGQHYANQDDLINALKPKLAADMTLLVKGSRSARMENVVAGLLKS